MESQVLFLNANISSFRITKRRHVKNSSLVMIGILAAVTMLLAGQIVEPHRKQVQRKRDSLSAVKQ
jgi:hypothetical protein